jgi:hypothetical protein
MNYTNSQLAFYIAKKVNEVRSNFVEAAKALNKVNTKLAEYSCLEVFVGDDSITILGSDNGESLELVVSIEQQDTYQPFDVLLEVSFSSKEKLLISLEKDISTVEIFNWILFNFEVETVWDINTME